MRLMAMHRAWGGGGALVLASVGLAACATSGTSTEPTQASDPAAMSVCENALRVPVATAMATTVGEIRGLTVGPGARPAEHAFGGLADDSPAAWCWTGGSGTYVSYGATPDGQLRELVSVGGVSRAPSGPPLVP